MKPILLGLLVACVGSPAPKPIPTPLCGDSPCDQICVAVNFGPGTPVPDREFHVRTEYWCQATALTGSSFSCGEVHDGKQECTALVPSAPPHGG